MTSAGPALDGLAPSGLPLTHLRALTDELGLFEHAEHDLPRHEHGYCLDDVARGLLVAVRAGDDHLVETYLLFVEQAIVDDGRAHNRRDAHGTWTDEPGLGDWWGRAVCSLGTVAAVTTDVSVQARALVAFERAAQQRSPHLRAMASAAIGAAEVVIAGLPSARARALIADGVAMIPPPVDPGWPWPERRLRYGNATIADALLAAGDALQDTDIIGRGMSALSFLLLVETRGGHLSVTGVDGRGEDDRGVQFDQQPIEVSAIADACARAAHLGLGRRWADAVALSWAWFAGDNDARTPMFDPATGAGFDGLEATGRNSNRGAESTLAALNTRQQLLSLGT